MSYTRTYNRTISEKISKHLSVSYTNDSNGKLNTIRVTLDNKSHNFSGNGSKTIDINTEIPVTIDIDVDTTPFDRSVDQCNTNVNLLTGAVVATEAAQIVSIQKNSEKVAGTIVNGFFGYIRSEISQQINELTQSIDAQLMHLRELSQACMDKKRQMDVDFTRISGRYIKIFDDLNVELYNRVHELDKPTFVFRKELDKQQQRSTNNDLISVASLGGQETGQLLTKLSVSVTKKRALDTLTQVKIFLWQQNHLNRTIQKSRINESVESAQFAPVCFIEMQEEQGKIVRQVHSPSFVSNLNEPTVCNQMINQFHENESLWQTINTETKEQIQSYLTRSINEKYQQLDTHSDRVRNMIQSLAQLHQMDSINY
jgi:hypothetical protein